MCLGRKFHHLHHCARTMLKCSNQSFARNQGAKSPTRSHCCQTACLFSSSDVRKQMREVTERLGGAYSPDLHRGCTHLVVQISSSMQECSFLLGNFVIPSWTSLSACSIGWVWIGTCWTLCEHGRLYWMPGNSAIRIEQLEDILL